MTYEKLQAVVVIAFCFGFATWNVAGVVEHYREKRRRRLRAAAEYERWKPVLAGLSSTTRYVGGHTAAEAAARFPGDYSYEPAHVNELPSIKAAQAELDREIQRLRGR